MITPRLPAVSLFFAALFAGAAQAGCPEDAPFCMPVYGCVAATGEVFEGFTYGQHKGPVTVASSLGVQCQGTWRRQAFGGKGAVACSDGRRGAIKFNYFNAQTGTVGGAMDMSDGRVVEVFAGQRVSAFLKSGRKIRGKAPACRALIEPLLGAS